MNREGQVVSLQRESVMVKNRRQERMCPPIHKLTNESRTCVLVLGGTWEPVDTIEKHQVRAGLLLCHRLFSKLHLHFLTNATMNPILKRMMWKLTEVK